MYVIGYKTLRLLSSAAFFYVHVHFILGVFYVQELCMSSTCVFVKIMIIHAKLESSLNIHVEKQLLL